MMGAIRIIFRILYPSVYFLLYAVLIALLFITPSDIIVRSLQTGQKHNIWVMTVCIVTTVLIVAFVYVLRLYVNKTVLASIPKTWVPVERVDVKKPIYKMIQAGLDRSATIAFEARPRVSSRAGEDEPAPGQISPQDQHHERAHIVVRLPTVRTGTADAGVSVLSAPAMWAKIEHPGWASPNSPDLPNLQYTTVISELPHLIEAKALALAPPDPTSDSQPPMLDPEAVALLQRAPNVNLRAYLEHLVSLRVLDAEAPVAGFLKQYEHARFSTGPVSSAHFRELMSQFAAILHGMKPLDLDAWESGAEDDNDDDADDVFAPSESDIDNDAPARTNPSTPGGTLSRSVTVSTQGSVARPPGSPSANTWRHYRTAPTTPRSRRGGMLSRQSSSSSSLSVRRQVPVRQASTSTMRSRTSNDSRSIIRLATSDDLSDLPFVLSLRDTAGST
jgi:hypothetical protein